MSERIIEHYNVRAFLYEHAGRLDAVSASVEENVYNEGTPDEWRGYIAGFSVSEDGLVRAS